jgi:hypothetical protein
MSTTSAELHHTGKVAVRETLIELWDNSGWTAMNEFLEYKYIAFRTGTIRDAERGNIS